jgi:hypothetical protein
MRPLTELRHSCLTLALAIALVSLLSCGPGEAPPADEPRPTPTISDALAPTTSDADAVTKQLHTTTLCTTESPARWS